MRLSNLLLTLFRFFLPPALICTLLLYFNAPLLDCTFPLARKPEAGCSIPGQQKPAIPGEAAPFRLLAFADPQLEGDSSIHSVDWRVLGWKWEHEGFSGVVDGVREGVVGVLKGWRKKIDLWGNDLYLAHTYRGVSWWSQPTHVVVLGDLLGSQWVSDGEFKRRSERFWKKVFRGAEKVPASITGSSGRVEVLGQDERWRERVIAVAGNHDIGYAGDIDAQRVERFEEAFGAVNWDVTFRLSNSSDMHTHGTSPFTNALSNDPELHLVILNSMNLDSPAKDTTLQQESRDFALHTLSREAGHFSSSAHRRRAATVLLTHIPFDKPSGTCADDTFFDWFPPSPAPDGGGGGIKEQNHLSRETSHFLLDSIASSSGQAIVLNGHDHVGCQSYHSRYIGHTPPIDSSWETVPLSNIEPEMLTQDYVGMREVTVRSMMGEFWGNVGFLSGWFDWEEGGWKFEYQSCALGVQHFWWGVHIFDLVVIGLGIGGLLLMILEEMAEAREDERERQALKKKL